VAECTTYENAGERPEHYYGDKESKFDTAVPTTPRIAVQVLEYFKQTNQEDKL